MNTSTMITTTKLKIYAIHNGSGSRYYRMIPQLKYMQSLGHEVILSDSNDQQMEQHIQWSDIVILEMVFSAAIVKLCKKLGKKVVFECDDLIHTVPKTHYSYDSIKGFKNKTKVWKEIINCLRHCDGFITTNETLKKQYGWLAKKSLVFDNYLDITHWLKEYKPNHSDMIRLLWAGSTSHKGDLLKFKPIMKRILEKYPHVKFIYVGDGGVKTDDLQAKFIYGDDLWEGIPNNRENILAVPGNIWPYKLAALQADIAIAPLQKNFFNKCKSQCKYLEYSINKIPAVYSAHHYTNVLNRHTGILAETDDDWVCGLSYLIENEKERKRIGENAYNDSIKKYDMSAHVSRWSDFILNL